MTQAKLIYSIGHSSLSAETFEAYLSKFHVRCLLDVRRYPGSRRHPQFGRHELARRLSDVSIEYLHLGGLLGGHVDMPYEDYRSTPPFEAGMLRLEDKAMETRCAFMCAEKNPWQCHRRFIADALSEKGWTVRHIVDGELYLIS